MRLKLALAGWLALMGAAHAQTVIDGSDSQIPKDKLEAAYKMLGSKMADPMAVQLRGLKVKTIEKRGGASICGEMNAKNLNGAYTGFHPFIFSPKDSSEPLMVTGAERDPAMRSIFVKIAQAWCD